MRISHLEQTLSGLKKQDPDFYFALVGWWTLIKNKVFALSTLTGESQEDVFFEAIGYVWSRLRRSRIELYRYQKHVYVMTRKDGQAVQLTSLNGEKVLWAMRFEITPVKKVTPRTVVFYAINQYANNMVKRFYRNKNGFYKVGNKTVTHSVFQAHNGVPRTYSTVKGGVTKVEFNPNIHGKSASIEKELMMLDAAKVVYSKVSGVPKTVLGSIMQGTYDPKEIPRADRIAAFRKLQYVAQKVTV